MRLIDADALLKEIDRIYKEHYANSCYQFIHDFFRAMFRRILKAPTIDAEPVKHGRWEPRKDALGFVCCSVCHDCNIYGDWADGKKWNYCPNCGCKMDLEG